MDKISWVFRCISTFVSAIARMLVENPAALVNNAQEKLRQAGCLGSVHAVKINGFNSTSVSSLAEQGEPTRALQRFSELGYVKRFIYRAQKRKLSNQLALWSYPVPRSSREACDFGNDVQNRGPTKVLYFANNSTPFTHSGYTIRTQKLLKALNADNFEVISATRLGYPLVIGSFPKKSFDVVDGITYLRLVPWLYPSDETKRIKITAKLIVKESANRRIDLLHTTTDYKNGLVVAEAAKQLGVPWVYEVRGQLESTWLSKFPSDLQEVHRQSEYYRETAKKELQVMAAADLILTLSEVSKQELISRGIDEEKIFVAPNAIDPSEIVTSFDKWDLRGELGISVGPEDVLIGSISSVVDYEGLDFAVLALHQLPKQYKLLIVGDGVARPALEEFVTTENLTDRVIFVGRQANAEVWKWYGALDIFVVPRRDTQVCRVVTPIKTLMAQAMGVPIVSSDLPALREIAKAATFVAPEDPYDLARGIRASIEYLKSQELKKSFPETRTWESNATIIGHGYRFARFGTRPD